MISAQTLRVCREGKPVSTPHQVRGRLFPDHALGDAATDLVPHLFAEGLSARGSLVLRDIEPVEHVEILENGMAVACHGKNAEQFRYRPAGARDFPSADRVGAAAGGEAAQLRHVGSGQRPADGVAEIVAEPS
jgi:hypothetical protein